MAFPLPLPPARIKFIKLSGFGEAGVSFMLIVWGSVVQLRVLSWSLGVKEGW